MFLAFFPIIVQIQNWLYFFLDMLYIMLLIKVFFLIWIVIPEVPHAKVIFVLINQIFSLFVFDHQLKIITDYFFKMLFDRCWLMGILSFFILALSVHFIIYHIDLCVVKRFL